MARAPVVVSVLSCMLTPAVGHFALVWPPSRTGATVENFFDECGTSTTDIHDAPRKVCMYFNEGSQIGCNVSQTTAATGVDCGGPPGGDYSSEPCCDTLMAPTLTDPRLRTYDGLPYTMLDPPPDYRYNPWRAPGYAAVVSPCGLAGGSPKPFYNNGGGPPPEGVAQGADGRALPRLPGAPAVWHAGAEEEVAWMVGANHGGGYAYRLCPASKAATEECFTRGQLEFAGAQSWAQWGTDRRNRTVFGAVRTSNGTKGGGQWTKNPIAPCRGFHGGSWWDSCKTPAWEPALPWLVGYGTDMCLAGTYYNFTGDDYQAAAAELGVEHPCSAEDRRFFAERFANLSVWDKVVIPPGLPAGEYVLSLRVDSEQTAQIWTICSDVTVVGAPA